MTDAVAKPAVALLLPRVCPPAVFRRVVAVAINSINAVPLGGALAHVGIEVLKLLPSVAKLNAPPAVFRKTSTPGVLASLADFTPRLIFWRSAHSVCPVGLASHLLEATPAARSRTCGEAPSENNAALSAVAKATPIDPLIPVRGALQNGEATKFLACDIVKFWHGIQYHVAILRARRRGRGIL